MIHDLKPYPAYKDSGVLWLGEVPEHWNVKRLKQCVERFYAGGTPDSGNVDYYCDTSKGLPWLMIADMTHQRHVKTTIKAITEMGRASKNLEVLPKGTLLYSMYASLGTTSVLEIEAAINQAIIGIKTKNFELETEFALYFLENLQPHVILLSSSSTQANLNAEKVRSLPIYLPSLFEQSAIVRYLDHIDRRIRRYIRAKQKLIKLLEEQKQAIIHQAVTRGLDPNVKLKPSGVEWLGDVPEHWEVRKLKVEVTFTGGGTPSKANAEFWIGNIPWVSPKDMKTSVIKDTEDHISELAVAESATNLIDPGAVLIVVRSGILRRKIPVAINNVSVALNQDMKALRSKGRLHNEYLFAFIEGCQKILLTEWTKQGATVESIEYELMANSFIPIPPRNEQLLIVHFLNEVNKNIESVIAQTRREISLLREYRTRLIADVVTGKLDVREAATNLPEETEEIETLDEVLEYNDETTDCDLELTADENLGEN